MFREKLNTKLNDSEAGILDVITWIANYKGETLASKLRYNKFSKCKSCTWHLTYKKIWRS